MPPCSKLMIVTCKASSRLWSPIGGADQDSATRVQATQIPAFEGVEDVHDENQLSSGVWSSPWGIPLCSPSYRSYHFSHEYSRWIKTLLEEPGWTTREPWPGPVLPERLFEKVHSIGLRSQMTFLHMNAFQTASSRSVPLSLSSGRDLVTYDMVEEQVKQESTRRRIYAPHPNTPYSPENHFD